jgi:hypothetical protein
MQLRPLAYLPLVAILSACGGGGGSSAAAPTAATKPSLSGDMMAFTANRGWNYQGTLNGQAVTVSLYADPTLAPNSTEVLAGAAVLGTVPTALTSRANALANEIGGLGLQKLSDGSHVAVEVSAGGTGVVPGNPLLAPGTLTLGQTWVPTTGANATVTAVGTVPGMGACSGATAGVEVSYTYTGGYSNTIAYVPGCGITYVSNNNNSQSLTLISVASYSLGDLSVGRRVQSASWMDTARTVLGLGHIEMPAAQIVKGLF